MGNFWKGAFVPTVTVFKHRDKCGDIRNHLQVVSYEVINEGDEEEKEWVAHIYIGFIDGTEEVYDYEYPVESPDVSEEEVFEMAVSEITG